MKKLIAMSAMAVFLSGMAAQAQSTISWDFDTPGDVEGWEPSHAPSMTAGLVVTNGFDSVVLTAPDITGGDPGIAITTNLTVSSGEFWDTVEIRFRTLNGNGGTPVTYDSAGTLMVVNLPFTIVTDAIGGAGWINTVEAGEWLVSSYDISELQTNDINYLRIDVPTGDVNGSFELDYVRVHATTNVPPPPVYKTAWEFNTPGDLEGWDSGPANITDPLIANAIDGGPESVLTAGTPGVADPYVRNSADPANLEPGLYWSNVVVRIRLHDGTFPIAWGNNDATLFLNSTPMQVGGSAWTVTDDGNDWVIASASIAFLGTDNIFSMRLDPFGESLGRNFELDYIRFETSMTPPVVPSVYEFEFNTLGDVEGWTGHLIDGLTVANAVSGGDVVLTCADITGGDSGINWSGLSSPEGKYWESIEIRVRLLNGNGGSPVPWIGGDLMIVNSTLVHSIGGAGWDTTVEPSGEWVTTLYDISALDQVNITSLRFDFTGNDAENFEVDYIRLHRRDFPTIPNTIALVKAWEFNTPGDTEDITTRSPGEVVGLTAATAITGSEGVLTSADITGLDPWVFYNDGNADPSLSITPPGPWTTFEIRIRQLDGNPGDLGVASGAFEVGGYLFQVNPWTGSTIYTTDWISVIPEADNWYIAVYDISALGTANLDGFRLDPVGDDDTRNFEVDYIRFNAENSPYGTWAETYNLSGADALDTADPDMDTYNNLYEYGFGGDPTNAAVSGFSTGGSVEEGGTNYLEHVYARRHGFKQGVDYSTILKDDLILGSWINIGTTAEMGSFEFNAAYEIVTNRVEIMDAESQQFMSAEVTGE